MTVNERDVLMVLSVPCPCGNRKPQITPTRIGVMCGNIGWAASWACRHLKKLRDLGLVKRRDPGVYSITDKGLKALGETQ